MVNDKLVQGYVELDKVEITEEYRELLNQLQKEYLMDFSFLKEINGRELYYIVMRDETRINDIIVENEDGTTETKYGLFTVMSPRHPVNIGVWNQDGTPLGQTKIVTPATYSEEGELITEEIIVYEGNPTYPFNKVKYLPYMNNIVTYDEEGNVLTSIKPTEPKPIRLFSGFNSPIM